MKLWYIKVHLNRVKQVLVQLDWSWGQFSTGSILNVSRTSEFRKNLFPAVEKWPRIKTLFLVSTFNVEKWLQRWKMAPGQFSTLIGQYFSLHRNVLKTKVWAAIHARSQFQVFPDLNVNNAQYRGNVVITKLREVDVNLDSGYILPLTT